MLLFVVCAASVASLPVHVLWGCVSVCMFMGGRDRMGIVRSLWGVSTPGSLGGQLVGDCKYSVCMWVCVCVYLSQAERGTAVGLCPGLQGGIRTTLTHTILLLSLLFYPSHDPSLPRFSSHFSFTIFFPTLLLRSSVPLHLLICVVVVVVSGGTVIKQSKVWNGYLIHHVNI